MKQYPTTQKCYRLDKYTFFIVHVIYNKEQF